MLKHSSENRILLKNTIMMYLLTAARYIFPLLTFPYLTRILAPDLYGVVTFMMSTMTYFQLLLDFGFKYSATKDASEKRNDTQALSELTMNVMMAKLILSAAGLVMLFAFTLFIGLLREYMLLSLMYYISVVANIFIPDFLYRGIEKMGFITKRYVLTKAISVALVFLLVRGPGDLLWIPITNIVGTLAAAVYSFAHMKRVLGMHFCRPNFKHTSITLKAANVYFWATFATTAFGAVNTLVMGAVGWPSADVAYWGVAYQIISIVLSLYDPIISSIYPRMVIKKDFKLIRQLLLVLMPVVIGGVILLYFLAEWIVVLLSGSDYLPAIPVLKLLLPVLLFSFPAQLMGFPVLGVMRREKLATIATVVSAIFHVTGLATLFAFGVLSLYSVAILRSCTEMVLFLFRTLFVVINRKLLTDTKSER